MAKDKKSLVKMLKKISRESQLQREAQVGRVRAKTFGGKPSVRQERRDSKKRLRDFDA